MAQRIDPQKGLEGSKKTAPAKPVAPKKAAGKNGME